jgi:hypothetical protein
MEIYKIQKQLEKLAEAIRRNLYWESLSFINQYENENLSEGKIIEWSEVAKLMELPRLLKENTFAENCRIGFRKSYRVKIWNTRELFFRIRNTSTQYVKPFRSHGKCQKRGRNGNVGGRIDGSKVENCQ